MDSFLTTPLPVTVSVDSRDFEINTDFRVSVRFEILMQEDIDNCQKLLSALQLYYPVIPENLEQAIEKMLWFYSPVENKSPKGGSAAKQVFSYTCDGSYIYSAFLDQYGIDLIDIPYLHWWKFKAMFQGLKSDHMISKIMRYRAAETTSEMSKEEKKHLQQIKRLYAIPLPKSEQQKLTDIENVLLNGGDITKVL